MKLFKGILETLATLIYIFIFTIFMYVGYAGWFKILPISRLKEDDAPLIAVIINFFYLLLILILSFITEDTVQDNLIMFLCYNILINAIVIVIGIILYIIHPNSEK